MVELPSWVSPYGFLSYGVVLARRCHRSALPPRTGRLPARRRDGPRSAGGECGKGRCVTSPAACSLIGIGSLPALAQVEDGSAGQDHGTGPREGAHQAEAGGVHG